LALAIFAGHCLFETWERSLGPGKFVDEELHPGGPTPFYMAVLKYGCYAIVALDKKGNTLLVRVRPRTEEEVLRTGWVASSPMLICCSDIQGLDALPVQAWRSRAMLAGTPNRDISNSQAPLRRVRICRYELGT